MTVLDKYGLIRFSYLISMILTLGFLESSEGFNKVYLPDLQLYKDSMEGQIDESKTVVFSRNPLITATSLPL